MSWTIDQSELPEMHPDSLGSVFTVGNGAWCTRGALAQDRHRYRATLLSGVVTSAKWGLI
jgi:trehalose/maltose hydrolase-like predicted phosphorylase